ncbi:hypothetical protein BC628DRAFT_142378 [Trametes gibbosa]|nr:hypothetical protein BC628DRAFT_142378 [Trametes gibbosa]
MGHIGRAAGRASCPSRARAPGSGTAVPLLGAGGRAQSVKACRLFRSGHAFPRCCPSGASHAARLTPLGKSSSTQSPVLSAPRASTVAVGAAAAHRSHTAHAPCPCALRWGTSTQCWALGTTHRLPERAASNTPRSPARPPPRSRQDAACSPIRRMRRSHRHLPCPRSVRGHEPRSATIALRPGERPASCVSRPGRLKASSPCDVRSGRLARGFSRDD